MSQITAVAVETLLPNGQPARCVVGKLEADSGQLLMVVTNDDGYDEFKEVRIPFTGTLKLQALDPNGKSYSYPVSITGSEVTLRVGGTQKQPQDIVLPACVPFKKASVLPAPPTRDQLCGVRHSFQGLTVITRQYGSMPWFSPALGWLDNVDDRNAAYDAHKAVGDTHLNLTLSGQYHEFSDPSNFYNKVTGRDYAYDLSSLRELITEAIVAGTNRGLPNGFMVLLALAGDGNSINTAPQQGQYNDPQGWTYGYEWLMRNFNRVWTSLRGDNGEGPDLTPWILPMPGYDGVVPGWQPWSRVNAYVRWARTIVGPKASLAIELSSGYPSWSGEDNDWAGDDGQMFDVILSEFPYVMGPPDLIPSNLLVGRNWKPMPPLTNEQRAPFDQVWQIVGAMVLPFNRPADMPNNDYPQGIPYRLGGGTPRGDFFYVAFEFDTYGWVRGCPLSQVEAHRQVFYDLGCKWVG